jgi:hypothetical protein
MRISTTALAVAGLLTAAISAAAQGTVPYDLKIKGVTFTAEPAAKANQFGHRTAYVEDPSGVRIELVEHAECAAGQALRESR